MNAGKHGGKDVASSECQNLMNNFFLSSVILNKKKENPNSNINSFCSDYQISCSTALKFLTDLMSQF